MKKLIVTALIALVLFVSLTSQASAYPASMTEADQAARPFITTNLRTVKTNVLAEIPSRMRDYILWDRLSSIQYPHGRFTGGDASYRSLRC